MTSLHWVFVFTTQVLLNHNKQVRNYVNKWKILCISQSSTFLVSLTQSCYYVSKKKKKKNNKITGPTVFNNRFLINCSQRFSFNPRVFGKRLLIISCRRNSFSSDIRTEVFTTASHLISEYTNHQTTATSFSVCSVFSKGPF